MIEEYVLRNGKTIYTSNVTILCGENSTGKTTALKELHDIELRKIGFSTLKNVKRIRNSDDFGNVIYIDLKDGESPYINGIPEDGEYLRPNKSDNFLGTNLSVKKCIVDNPNLTKGMKRCRNIVDIISILEYANECSSVFMVQPENGLYDNNIAYLVDLISFLATKRVKFFILTYNESIIRRFRVNVKRSVLDCSDIVVNMLSIDNIFKIPIQNNGSLHNRDDNGEKYVWSDLFFNQEDTDLDTLIFDESMEFPLHE